MTRPILPGATLGVLGGGQLGRMFTIAARRLGYRVHVLSPEDDTPTGQVADVEIKASYDDLAAVERFARDVAVVTFEFENVPAATARTAAAIRPVRPAGSVLHTTQHRLREKSFLRDAGIPVTTFAAAHDAASLARAMQDVGVPAVIKTASWGYDGKGQRVVRDAAEARAAFDALGGVEVIVERMVAFERELSVVAARGVDGAFEAFGPIENRHAHHILDLSFAPADLPEGVARRARELARAILEALDVVGVLCIEFFATADGTLLVNELAPRPHNSGHLTIDACETDQFEQQVRTICGLPLGSMRQTRAAAMANLLGDLWTDGEPDWVAALAEPETKLHLYGKAKARPGRKMGHLTSLADTTNEAIARALRARSLLRGSRVDG